jgi:hypothetical protein
MVPPPVVKAPAYSNRMIRATNRSMEQLCAPCFYARPKIGSSGYFYTRRNCLKNACTPRDILVAKGLVRIKALFQEWIAIHVIAVLFPEARNIVACELQSTHPLH